MSVTCCVPSAFLHQVVCDMYFDVELWASGQLQLRHGSRSVADNGVDLWLFRHSAHKGWNQRKSLRWGHANACSMDYKTYGYGECKGDSERRSAQGASDGGAKGQWS